MNKGIRDFFVAFWGPKKKASTPLLKDWAQQLLTARGKYDTALKGLRKAEAEMVKSRPPKAYHSYTFWCPACDATSTVFDLKMEGRPARSYADCTGCNNRLVVDVVTGVFPGGPDE